MKHVPPFEEAATDFHALGTELDEGGHRLISRYCGLLEESSSGTNLIGPAELPRIWKRHVLESAAFITMLDRERPVVDIGSGAGFPGMILAMMGMDVEIVEPRRRRCEFLRGARTALGLLSVRIVRSRIERRPPYPDGTQFTARSVMPPERLMPLLVRACEGAFTCTVRLGEPQTTPAPGILAPLPSPPLDRPGFLLQFRHPD